MWVGPHAKPSWAPCGPQTTAGQACCTREPQVDSTSYQNPSPRHSCPTVRVPGEKEAAWPGPPGSWTPARLESEPPPPPDVLSQALALLFRWEPGLSARRPLGSGPSACSAFGHTRLAPCRAQLQAWGCRNETRQHPQRAPCCPALSTHRYRGPIPGSTSAGARQPPPHPPSQLSSLSTSPEGCACGVQKGRPAQALPTALPQVPVRPFSKPFSVPTSPRATEDRL